MIRADVTCPGCQRHWSFQTKVSWWLFQQVCWGCSRRAEEARRG